MENETLTEIRHGREAEIPIDLAISECPPHLQCSFGSSRSCTAPRTRIWQVPKVICWNMPFPGRVSRIALGILGL
jgi:hypothetical protein